MTAAWPARAWVRALVVGWVIAATACAGTGHSSGESGTLVVLTGMVGTPPSVTSWNIAAAVDDPSTCAPGQTTSFDSTTACADAGTDMLALTNLCGGVWTLHPELSHSWDTANCVGYEPIDDKTEFCTDDGSDCTITTFTVGAGTTTINVRYTGSFWPQSFVMQTNGGGEASSATHASSFGIGAPTQSPVLSSASYRIYLGAGAAHWPRP